MSDEPTCPDCGAALLEIRPDAAEHGNVDLLPDGGQRWRCESCDVMWRAIGDGLERA
jgi:hypothetical protein